MSRPPVPTSATARPTTRATTRATTRPRARVRHALAAVATVGLAVAPASAASAHVRVIPDTTTAGGFAQLTFRVPTESDTASTVSVRVELPTDTPLTSVRTRPLPGWTAVVERGPLPVPVERDGATITEAPTAVVWTARPGAEIGPGQYGELAISVGPLPEAGTELLLPATQTYSDGEEVSWSQAPAADGSEPELPAPVLVTTEAAADEGHHGGAAPTTADDGSGGAAGAAADDVAGGTQDDGARLLGGTGLALGAAGLVTAAVRRRPAGAAPAPAPAGTRAPGTTDV